MRSPPHLNLSQAASGSLCSTKTRTMDTKSTCVLSVPTQGYSQFAEPGEHSQRHNIVITHSILNEVLLNVFVQKPLSVAQIFTPLHSDA